MQFNPLTEDELTTQSGSNQKSFLFEPGDYTFEIIGADDHISKAGNESIKLRLSIFDHTGTEHYIFDYLSPNSMYKLHQFCKSVGLIEQYKKGELSTIFCLGKSGKARIGLEKGKPKNDGSDTFYDDRMVIKKYIESDSKVVNENVKTKNLDLLPISIQDDDLPF